MLVAAVKRTHIDNADTYKHTHTFKLHIHAQVIQMMH
jgi:hypothetical protein